MRTKVFVTWMLIATFSLIVGCETTSPLAESNKQAVEADIDDIMSYEVDATEVGEPKRCLSESEYRDYRPLGERHLLFEGRRGKQWINVLRSRCRNLEDGDFFVIKSSGSRQICSLDQFQVADRIGATSWGSLGTGPTCTFGQFMPVTNAQVEEIENRLETL